MKTTLLVSICVAALSATASANATLSGSYATASVDNLQLSVVDLAPSDGVAASFAVGASNSAAYSLHDNDYDGSNLQVGFDAASRLDDSNFARSASANGTVAGLSLETAATVNAVSQGYTPWYMHAEATTSITLAPHTELDVFADVNLAYFSAGNSSNTSAVGSLLLFTQASSSGLSIDNQVSFVAGQGSSSGGFARLQNSILNPYDSPMQIVFQVTTDSNAYGAISSVPEPANVSLMLAALCVMGVLAKRRAR